VVIYNIDSVNESKLVELVMKNTNNLSYVSVVIEDNQIEVKLSKEIKGIIGKMFGFNLIEASSHYEGKIVNGEKKIERIK
jgi:hypothetical protein